MAHGPWQRRVQFTSGGFAFRPGEVLARANVADLAQARLREVNREEIETSELLGGAWIRFTGVDDALPALGQLLEVGIMAQPNHVLFATGCCPPHPSLGEAEDVDAAPFMASPFMASAVGANPFMASPFMASPFMASGYGGGGCCCWTGGPAVAAYPFMASANPSPSAASWFRETGRRRSSARPARGRKAAYSVINETVRVAILDTGIAGSDQPGELANMKISVHGSDAPDEDGDRYLDPVAGHGTFIAGVIENLAPGCELEIFEVLTTYGDGHEAKIAKVLWSLADEDRRDQLPHFVNLSFGGYSPVGMGVLADAIAALTRLGVVVVASAGNDATCFPSYPAALPEVVGVAALDQGRPAPYTNYGPWVRACTQGTDVVSLFFDGFNGAEPAKADGTDTDKFGGWARWSGTSFAAPRVVAALAREVTKTVSPQDAVDQFIDDEQLPRIPMLGTVVLP